jgi:hypothetical protein
VEEDGKKSGIKKLACSGQRREGTVHNELQCFEMTMMIMMNIM